MANQISAIDIKQLWHTEPLTQVPTAPPKGTEIKNVHQDTWSIDEAEPSQDSYRNQLTGMVYRRGTKTMGEVTFSFTIGRYDFVTKAALMGGTVIMDGDKAVGWERSKTPVTKRLCLTALTEDGVYCVLTNADIVAREANTDGAVGIAVTALALEPENEEISSEYWFNS